MAYWNTPTKRRKANQRKERRKPLDEDVPSEPSDDATRDDDVDDEVPTPKARKTPSKKAKAASKELTEDEEEGSDEERKLVLLIPQASSEGSKRVCLTLPLSFDEALDVIHEIIGCANVPRKPNLAWKLSTSAQRVKPIDLCSDEDWAGCLEDVAAAERKKKNQAVSVTIIVDDQYMNSLRAHAVTKKKPSKGKKTALLDLNNGDDDDEEDVDEGMAEKERKALEKLEKALGDCQKCGPTKLCKVNKNGQHVHLTFNQRRGWSIALAMQTHGVTLRTPPKGELFAGFHGSSFTEGTKEAVSDTMGAFGMSATFPWQQMLPFMLPGMVQAMAQSAVPQGAAAVPRIPSKPLARSAPPSSDPPDYGNQIQYATITNFLTTLNDRHPLRALATYHNSFELMDYYHIDELARMTEVDLTGPDFRMTSGNAKFLLKEARDEVRRVERAAKRAGSN